MKTVQTADEQELAPPLPNRNVGKIVLQFVVMLAGTIALMAFVWSR